MPSDDIENDEFGPTFRDRGEARRRRRQETAETVGTNMPPAPLPTGTAHQVELLLAKRQNRVRNIFIRLGLAVVLPTFVVWFYTALIATPRYVSTFEITYQAYAPTTTLASGLVQSLAGSSVADNVDYGTLLYEYIRSEALADKVDRQIGFRAHFSSHKIDPLSRLAAKANQPEFLAYWRSHVSVAEGFGGYLTVQVQGFDPAFTLLLAQTIANDADDMIDGLNAPAEDSEIKAAKDQLRAASAELKNADDTLTEFRNTHGDLDPNFAATELAAIIGQLEGQLALLKAQLQQAEANMQPDASQIVQLKLQVNALVQQIASERRRLSDSSSPSYSDTVSKYNDLLADQQFATADYQSAQQGLIVADADAAAKQNYAVDFVPPVMPQRATLPDPFTSSLTTFLVFLSLYGIGSLLLAAFRDQAGV